MLKTEGLQPVYVLHRRAYGDNSLLVDLFSRDHGRLSAVARGAQQARSSRAALLQPFLPLLATWRGKGELPTLGNVESAGRGVNLVGRRLFCGLYLNELLSRLLLRHDPHLSLFASYGEVIRRLASEPEEDLLRQFELILLQELGFGLLLDQEADNGQPIVRDRLYHYRIESGPVPAYDDRLLQIQGDTLLRLANSEALTERGRYEARQLMRQVLAPHLGNKPLKSRELFRHQATEHRE